MARWQATQDGPEAPSPISDQVGLSDIASEIVLVFHELWQSKHRDGRIPARADFSVDELGPWMGNIMIVDVLDGGADFHHRLIGTNIVEAVGRDLTGRRVSRCDYTIGAEAMLARYRAAFAARGPTFRKGRIAWARGRAWIAFESMTAPLAEDGARIDKLITVADYPGLSAQY